MKKNKNMILAILLLTLVALTNGVVKVDVTVNWKAMVILYREISSRIAVAIGVNVISQYIVGNTTQAKG